MDSADSGYEEVQRAVVNRVTNLRRSIKFAVFLDQQNNYEPLYKDHFPWSMISITGVSATQVSVSYTNRAEQPINISCAVNRSAVSVLGTCSGGSSRTQTFEQSCVWEKPVTFLA